jgi:hypothetical protein
MPRNVGSFSANGFDDVADALLAILEEVDDRQTDRLADGLDYLGLHLVESFSLFVHSSILS